MGIAGVMIKQAKGPAHSKNNLYFLAPAQTKRMQPILESCEEQFRSNFQKKHWSFGGHTQAL